MPVMTYREALRSAMADEMERDDSVVVAGMRISRAGTSMGAGGRVAGGAERCGSERGAGAGSGSSFRAAATSLFRT